MDSYGLSSSICPKYTSSFLNQLQTEWNEFVLEISHSTPHDLVPNCNLLESPRKQIAKAAFIESLNKLNHASSGNILIPVPLSALKRLFSPSKCNANEVVRNEFFNEIKDNLNLTKLSCQKLQKLLSIDESHDVSDFPSPSLPKHFRKSAPPNLFPKKKSKLNQIENYATKIVNRISNDEENQLVNNYSNSNVNFKKTKNYLENLTCSKVGKDYKVVALDSNEAKQNTNTISDKKLSKCVIKRTETGNIAKVSVNKNETNRSSSICSNRHINGSDTSSLFYTFQYPKKWSKPTIVCTYFSQKELSRIYKIIKKLGFYDIENHVSSRTTHLVCGAANKTINLCKAIARGCWILDKEWIICSEKENRWLLEERFEKKSLSPAVLENRLRRQKCGSTYRPDDGVFADCGGMYVSDRCAQPSAEDLKELILLGSGRIEESPERAAYIIGSRPKRPYVKEMWILNCTLRGYVVDVAKYVRN